MVLRAYVVARPDTSVDVEERRRALADSLPAWMVPERIVLLDALPLTANGKIDRKALPRPVQPGPARGFDAPQGPTEEALARIWSQVLGVDRIARGDNFFALGGDSILSL